MTAKKRHTREEQLAFVEAYKASNLSSQQFCEQHLISFTAFKNWLYRRKAENSSRSKLAFCKLTPASKETVLDVKLWFIRLRIPNGCVFEIPSELPTDQVQSFLRVLGVINA